MPNVYYLPPAWVSGVGDFLGSFSLARQRKEEMEAQVQAQNQAQGNQAAAGAFGNIAGGAVGGLVARNVPGLNPAQRLSLATSFMPGGGQISRMSGAIGSDVDRGERQAQAQQTALQNDIARMGTEAFVNQYGMLPPSDLSNISGPSASPPTDDPSAVPSPSINPAMTPAYQKARRDVAAYEAQMARVSSPMERQAIEQANGARIREAYQIIERAKAPAAPVTWQEMEAAGPHNGGYTRLPDGSLIIPKGMTHSAGPKEMGPQARMEARQKRIEEKVAQGATPVQAMQAVNAEDAAAQIVPVELPNGFKGAATVDSETGKIIKIDEINKTEANGGGSKRHQQAVDLYKLSLPRGEEAAVADPMDAVAKINQIEQDLATRDSFSEQMDALIESARSGNVRMTEYRNLLGALRQKFGAKLPDWMKEVETKIDDLEYVIEHLP